MVEIGSSDEIAEKWSRNASQAGQDFEAGVSGVSTSDQQAATLEAVSDWETGVQNAISNGTFQRGVENPSADWQERTLELGGTRFTSGVQASRDAFTAGFEPFRQVIADTDLPARGPRGDIGTNIERVRVIAQALNNERTGN